MDSFEDDGIFWLPGRESERIAGRLTFDAAEGSSLALLGAFGGIQAQLNAGPSTIRIHGIAGKRYLTLDQCFIKSGAVDFPGIARQNYYVGSIITNYLFGENELLNFDKFSVSFDQLPAWVRRSGVSVELKAPSADEHPDHLTIVFDEQQDDIVAFGDGEELRLGSTWSLSGDNITETYLRQGCYLKVVYPQAKPLTETLDDVKFLQDLLTLTTAAPAVPLQISLWRKDIMRELRPGESVPQDMDFYAGQLAERVRLNESQSPGHVLFQFQEIGGLHTIARWLEVARNYKVVLGSLLSIRYTSGLYVENRFHNVLSAAESFHRLRFSNEVVPKDEFKQFRRELVRAVPKEHRNWLGNQLQYSNEPRLRSRLAEMATYAGEAFKAVHSEPNDWVAVVTESRNRLVHHDAEQKMNFQPGDLYFLTESAFALVMLCLFRECEMSDGVLASISGNGNINFLRDKIAEIVPRLYAQIA